MRIGWRLRLCLVLAAVLWTGLGAGVPIASAAECTDTWVGPAEGFWSEASRWSAKAVPSESDVVCIPSETRVVINGGFGDLIPMHWEIPRIWSIRAASRENSLPAGALPERLSTLLGDACRGRWPEVRWKLGSMLAQPPSDGCFPS